MKSSAFAALLLLFCSCGGPPKPKVPQLNPTQAYEMLRFDPNGSKWMIYVQQKNPTCNWHLELPDQSSQPTEIDVDQIIWCGAAPAPREFRASAVFTYDKAEGRWKLTRFSS